MAPTERKPKRQKLSPARDSRSPNTLQSPTAASSPISNAPAQNVTTAPSSWYNRTWPRKAAPITQVARESISSASNTAIEAASIVKDKVTPTLTRKSSLALTLGKTTSYKSSLANATTTKDHAMPDGRFADTENVINNPAIADASAGGQKKDDVPKAAVQDTSRSEVAGKVETRSSEATATGEATTAPQSWIGWLANSGGGQTIAPATPQLQDTTKAPEPSKSVAEPSGMGDKGQSKRDQPKHPESVRSQATDQSGAASGQAIQRRSWLPIWNNSVAAQSAPVLTSPTEDRRKQLGAAAPEMTETTSQVPQTEQGKDGKAADENTIAASQSQAAGKSSAWVFWSRDKAGETRSLRDEPREGEIAVANTESESHPRRASIDVQGSTKPKAAAPDKSKIALADKIENKTKHKSTESKELKLATTNAAAKATKVETKGASATGVAPAEAETSRTVSPAPSKKAYEHLLLPALHETLRIPENLSLFQQLTRLLYPSKEPDLKRLNLVRDPHRIKNALAIGVHGYFPTPLIQSVLGRPTGTSIKFAEMAAKSVRRYTKSQGYNCQVKTAALDGEGKIAERIDLLWKLLLNWIEEIRKADFVMIACHSQGVPVAIMLVSKLIHFGCISSSARVGICAMAGVSMGPFPEFKSRWMSGSAGELFEFSDPNSKVSADYLAALDDTLRFGVRLTYVGSIDDQLVSLESSIFAPVSHPHIFRAVSIDSRVYAPNFVSHLVAFALKLRNLGVEDHGLIRELSVPLAGSLYTGEGHSRLYEDDAVYDLAVAFALETTSAPGLPLAKRDVASSGVNPFILPFAMRGMLEEDFVKSDLQEEVSQLLKQFDEWTPTTKALKDVKFRLEGIRSKL